MKTVSLSGSPRENVGKKDARALRSQSLVPCVIYGGDSQIYFSVKRNDINKLIFTPEVYKITVSVDGKDTDAIIQEVQYHPISDEVIHVDFLQLFDDKQVKVSLPVKLEGSSLGVRNGGKLSQVYRKLALKGLPAAFPEAIEVNIEDLRIGQSVRVQDINLEGVTFLDSPDSVVVAVKTSRVAVEEEEEETEEGGEEAAAEGEASAE